mmetsp:Transcript_124653/g.399348  ORF Transcript_124653/g.399348 Transcript_124653/m.399348 type:complete len:451 (+) Transcript_124653:68-1420(+)
MQVLAQPLPDIAGVARAQTSMQACKLATKHVATSLIRNRPNSLCKWAIRGRPHDLLIPCKNRRLHASLHNEVATAMEPLCLRCNAHGDALADALAHRSHTRLALENPASAVHQLQEEHAILAAVLPLDAELLPGQQHVAGAGSAEVGLGADVDMQAVARIIAPHWPFCRLRRGRRRPRGLLPRRRHGHRHRRRRRRQPHARRRRRRRAREGRAATAAGADAGGQVLQRGRHVTPDGLIELVVNSREDGVIEQQPCITVQLDRLRTLLLTYLMGWQLSLCHRLPRASSKAGRRHQPRSRLRPPGVLAKSIGSGLVAERLLVEGLLRDKLRLFLEGLPGNLKDLLGRLEGSLAQVLRGLDRLLCLLALAGLFQDLQIATELLDLLVRQNGLRPPARDVLVALLGRELFQLDHMFVDHRPLIGDDAAAPCDLEVREILLFLGLEDEPRHDLLL